MWSTVRSRIQGNGIVCPTVMVMLGVIFGIFACDTVSPLSRNLYYNMRIADLGYDIRHGFLHD